MKIVITRDEFDEVVREALAKKFGGAQGTIKNAILGDEIEYKMLGREGIECDIVQRCETVEVFRKEEK